MKPYRLLKYDSNNTDVSDILALRSAEYIVNKNGDILYFRFGSSNELWYTNSSELELKIDKTAQDEFIVVQQLSEQEVKDIVFIDNI